MEAQEQAKYEGWAIVEIMGHRTIAGHVTTKYFGTAAMIHITQPDHPAQEKILERGQYINGEYCDVGTKVRISREKAEAYVGAGSIYQLTVCSEEKALATQPVTVEIIEKVERKQITANIARYEDDESCPI